MISRVYYRGVEKVGEQLLNPTSQELFYEWKAVLSSDSQTTNVFLEIHNLTLNDRISTTPASTMLSEPQERWYSGFHEPHRSRPDYFVRTVKIPELSSLSSPLTVVIRRFLLRPLLSTNDLIKIRNFSASNCQTKLTIDAYVENAENLQSRSRILLENINRSNEARIPVPNRPDPGDLKDGEVQATTEVRCKNESCSEMNIATLEGRISKSPYERAREDGRKKLLALKKDLEGLLCMEGPYDDLDPTRDSQMIKMCDQQKHLSPDEMLRLKQIMIKHGFNVDITSKGTK